MNLWALSGAILVVLGAWIAKYHPLGWAVAAVPIAAWAALHLVHWWRGPRLVPRGRSPRLLPRGRGVAAPERALHEDAVDPAAELEARRAQRADAQEAHARVQRD